MLQYLTKWLDEYIKLVFSFYLPCSSGFLQCIHGGKSSYYIQYMCIHVGQLIIQNFDVVFELLNPL